MGREVRMVPKDYQHPKDEDGNFIPLQTGHGAAFKIDDEEWSEGFAKWQVGLRENYGGDEKWTPVEEEDKGMRYTEYSGARPSPDDYMPDWPSDVATHYMMYEDTTEGTPISPAFKTPEELARWLVDNNANAFGGQRATYEGWLRVAKGGYAPSAVVDGRGLNSGVDGLTCSA